MRRYGDNEPSIGEMILNAAQAYSQIKRQEEERQLAPILNTVKLLGAVQGLPESMRTNQEMLKHIDEALKTVSRGKFSLPRRTDQILGLQEAMQVKPTVGGMTPTNILLQKHAMQRLQPGEYLPISSPVKPIYGLTPEGMKPLGNVEASARVHNLPRGPEPVTVFDAQGEQLGVFPTKVKNLPETPQSKFERAAALKQIPGASSQAKVEREPLDSKIQREFLKDYLGILQNHARNVKDVASDVMIENKDEKINEIKRMKTSQGLSLLDSYAKRFNVQNWEKWKELYKKAKDHNLNEELEKLYDIASDAFGVDVGELLR